MNTDKYPIDRLAEPRFRWYVRATLASVGLGLLTLLITAATLDPNPRGYGTHRQLGLPPCSFKVMFDGKPCPSCGMTTSWSHLMHGQPIRSARANVGGMLLGMLALVVAPWLLVSSYLGRWWPGVPNEWISILIGSTIVIVTLVNWFVRLYG